jgi:hypothetical protein
MTLPEALVWCAAILAAPGLLLVVLGVAFLAIDSFRK